jgi:hypothetical protein
MASTVQRCPGSGPPALPVGVEQHLRRQVDELAPLSGLRSRGELAVDSAPLLLCTSEVAGDGAHDQIQSCVRFTAHVGSGNCPFDRRTEANGLTEG